MSMDKYSASIVTMSVDDRTKRLIENSKRKPVVGFEKSEIVFTAEAYRIYCNLQDADRFVEWAKGKQLDFVRLGTILSYSAPDEDCLSEFEPSFKIAREELKEMMDTKTMDELLLWSFNSPTLIYDNLGNTRQVPFDIDRAEIVFGGIERENDTKYRDYGHKWYDVFFFVSGWYQSLFW